MRDLGLAEQGAHGREIAFAHRRVDLLHRARLSATPLVLRPGKIRMEALSEFPVEAVKLSLIISREARAFLLSLKRCPRSADSLAPAGGSPHARAASSHPLPARLSRGLRSPYLHEAGESSPHRHGVSRNAIEFEEERSDNGVIFRFEATYCQA